jgi:serine/threonine-protein kinase
MVLGRYRVVSPLARGGMGIVFLARTEGAAGFSRPVVIKRVVPDLAGDEAAAQSFAREARILSNLQHPNIVNVIDFDEEDGAYVMVLEYVHGYNLGQWHRYILDTGRRMPVDHAIHIMTQVLEALDYAHTFTKADGTSMEIIHRDVSPGNILLDTQGHVKLLDFGIARANEGGEYKTRDGYFKGKLTYAAPEIYEGTAATPRSDVYSTAVVLYQLISGENPFRGKDTPDIVRKVLQVMPPPLAAAREDVPDDLDEVLARAMAKKAADRYATARAFAESLRALESVPEQEFLPALIGDLKADFNQDMPKKLGLELLQARDAAWRAAQDANGPRRALSSTPPPSELEGPTVEGTEIESIEIKTEKPVPSQIGRGTWIAAAAVFSLIVAAGAIFIVATRNREVVERPRFVVVEKPGAESPPGVNSVSTLPTATSEAPPRVEPPSAPPESVATAAPPTRGAERPDTKGSTGSTGPDPKALSRAFQRQQGRIENCFVSHVKEVDGRPEVAVRFKVDTSGHVTTAELSPAALNSTPLGHCIVGVARSTDFGHQPEPFSFTIPITARRVK